MPLKQSKKLNFFDVLNSTIDTYLATRKAFTVTFCSNLSQITKQIVFIYKSDC